MFDPYIFENQAFLLLKCILKYIEWNICIINNAFWGTMFDASKIPKNSF